MEAALAGSPPEDNHGFSCSVCLSSGLPESKKCVLDGCNHHFCVDCISEWSKKQLACPLCKSNFLTASVEFKPDGTFDTKIFEEPKPDPSTTAPDLSGLDFEVFIAESGRLLDNAVDAKKRLFCPNGMYWVHGARLTESTPHRILGSVYDRLSRIQQDLRNECRFEPEQLWSVLEQIDIVLKELWAGRAEFIDISTIYSDGNNSTSSAGSNKKQNSSRRYGAYDDYYDDDGGEEEEEDYYYDEDEYGEEYDDEEDDEEAYAAAVHIHSSSVRKRGPGAGSAAAKSAATATKGKW